MPKRGESDNDLRILICTAASMDAQMTAKALHQSAIRSQICRSMDDVCREFASGCGAILVAREILDEDSVHRLSECLRNEPPWSHTSTIVLASSGEVANAEATVTRLIGPLRNVTLLERPIRLVTLLGIVQSTLADRKRQYMTAELLHQLETSNRALTEFASVASHDLKEPLRGITTFVQLTLRQYKGKVLDAYAEKLLSTAATSAQRMSTLIDSLLGYASATADAAMLAEVRLREVVDAAVENLHLLIENTHASITIENLPTVVADRTLLVQLFQNLISNALKFTSGAPPRVVVDSVEEENRWVVSVKDNGIGIPKEYCAHIFEMFRRLHSNATYPGSGIGLAVCKKIVERHDGEIWLQSSSERGSTFSFSFPKLVSACKEDVA